MQSVCTLCNDVPSVVITLVLLPVSSASVGIAVAKHIVTPVKAVATGLLLTKDLHLLKIFILSTSLKNVKDFIYYNTNEIRARAEEKT
jgi:hypothetical protein